MRAECDAVIVGIGTVLQDDPRLLLDPRLAPGKSPLRVVLDTTLRTPRSARVLQGDAPTLIATGSRPRERELPDTEVVECGNDTVDLLQLLQMPCRCWCCWCCCCCCRCCFGGKLQLLLLLLLLVLRL